MQPAVLQSGCGAAIIICRFAVYVLLHTATLAVLEAAESTQTNTVTKSPLTFGKQLRNVRASFFEVTIWVCLF